MRAIGTINLEFGGLVTLPLAVSPFASYSDISFSYVCPEGHDIKNVRFCPTCNREIAFSELKKALKISKDEKIVFNKELIEAIKSRQDKSCRVLKVISDADANKLKYFIHKVYYALPKEKFEKGYFTLLKALSESKNALLIEFSLRSRKHLGLLEAQGKYLMLSQLIYAEQVRQPPILKEVSVLEKDIENTKLLLEALKEETANIMYADIKDNYKEEVIDAVLNGKTETKTEPKPQDSFSKGLELAVASLKKKKKEATA